MKRKKLVKRTGASHTSTAPRIRKAATTLKDAAVRIEFLGKNNYLLNYREKHNLTQDQMARLCGLSMIQYGAAERLQRASLNTMEVISKTLEIPIDTVFPVWAYKFGNLLNDQQAYLLLDDEVGRSMMSANVDTTFDCIGNGGSIQDGLEIVLRKLPDRTFDVVACRLGLFGREKTTFRALALKHKVSISRVSQIYTAGVKVLSTGVYRESLGEYAKIMSEQQRM